jgi:hypothetical protein
MAKDTEGIEQKMVRMSERVKPIVAVLRRFIEGANTSQRSLHAELREVLKLGHEGHRLNDEHQEKQARAQWVELSNDREKSTSRAMYYKSLLKQLEQAARVWEMNIVKAAVIPVISELAGVDGPSPEAIQSGIAVDEQSLHEQSEKLLALTQFSSTEDGDFQNKAGEFEAEFDRLIAKGAEGG